MKVRTLIQNVCIYKCIFAEKTYLLLGTISITGFGKMYSTKSFIVSTIVLYTGRIGITYNLERHSYSAVHLYKSEESKSPALYDIQCLN